MHPSQCVRWRSPQLWKCHPLDEPPDGPFDRSVYYRGFCWGFRWCFRWFFSPRLFGSLFHLHRPSTFRLRSPSTATRASSSSDKSSRDLRLRPPLAERGEGGPLLHVDDLKFGEAGPAMADAEVVAASSKFCFCTCPSLSVRT